MDFKYYKDTLLRIAKSRFPTLGISDQFLVLPEGQKSIPQEQCDAFNIICRELVASGSYDIIFKWIVLFFVSEDTAYDLEAIRIVFQGINVNGKYTLDDIRCLFLKEFDESYRKLASTKICEANYFAATKMTICKYILEISLDDISDGVSTEFSRIVAKKCREIKKDENEFTTEAFTFGISSSLLLSYRYSNEGSSISLDAESFFSIFVEQIAPVFKKHYAKYAHITGNTLVFIAVLYELHWLLNAHNTLFRYDSFESKKAFHSLEVVGTNFYAILQDRFFHTIKEDFPTADFINKLDQCSVDNEFSSKNENLGFEFSCESIGIGKALADCIIDGSIFMQYGIANSINGMNQSLVDDLYIHALVLLYMAGELDECRRILIRHGDKISDAHLHTPYVKLLISKLLLSSCDLYDARRLVTLLEVGVSNNELDFRKKELRNNSNSIIEKLQSLDKYDLLKYEVIEGYGKPIDIINDINIHNINNGYPERDDFEKLCYSVLGIAGKELPSEVWIVLRDVYELVAEVKTLMDRNYPLLEQADLWFNIKVLFDVHIAKLSIKSLLDDYNKLKESKKHRPIDESFFEDLDKKVSELVELYAELSKNNSDKKKAEESIKQSIAQFLTTYFPESPDKNLYHKLGNIEDEIKKYILTSEMVYDFLEKQGDKNLDYSAALISLTKALETILQKIMFVPMRNAAEVHLLNLKQNQKSEYIPSNFNIYRDCINKDNFIQGNVTGIISKIVYKNTQLMDYCTLFCPARKWDHVVYNNNTLSLGNNKESSHFKKFGGNAIFNIKALTKFEGLELKVRFGNKTYSVKFKGENEGNGVDLHNQLMLAGALNYIREEYRNPVAHTKGIDKELMNKGRGYMVGVYASEKQDNATALKLKENSKALIWILLSILK